MIKFNINIFILVLIVCCLKYDVSYANYRLCHSDGSSECVYLIEYNYYHLSLYSAELTLKIKDGIPPFQIYWNIAGKGNGVIQSNFFYVNIDINLPYFLMCGSDLEVTIIDIMGNKENILINDIGSCETSAPSNIVGMIQNQYGAPIEGVKINIDNTEILSLSNGMFEISTTSGTHYVAISDLYSQEVFVAPYGTNYIKIVLDCHAPYLDIQSQRQTVTINWSQVAQSEGYLLYYAPYPTAETIKSIDMGKQTNISFDAHGLSFYVAISSYIGEYISEFSNIEFFDFR